MSISKLTDTVHSVADTPILSVEQFSIRAKMQIPGSKTLAVTLRASTGTTRTVTTAEPHGLAVGDYILPGNFGNASYNPATSYGLATVTAVPSSTKVSFDWNGSLTEAETGDTAGVIVALKWKRLRMGMRWAIPRTSDLACGVNAFGLGVAQGAYPVQSANCVRWFGYSNTGQATWTYFNGNTLYIPYGQRGLCKAGTSYTGTMSFYTYDYLSNRRAYPGALFLEFTKGTNNYFALGWKMQTTSYVSSVTEAKFLAVLKSSIAFTSTSDQTLEGIQWSGYIEQLADGSLHPLLAVNGHDLYIETFFRAVGQPMEIMNIGYAITP